MSSYCDGGDGDGACAGTENETDWTAAVVAAVTSYYRLLLSHIETIDYEQFCCLLAAPVVIDRESAPSRSQLFIYSTGAGRSFVCFAPVFCSAQSKILRHGRTRIRLARTVTTDQSQFKLNNNNNNNNQKWPN